MANRWEPTEEQCETANAMRVARAGWRPTLMAAIGPEVDALREKLYEAEQERDVARCKLERVRETVRAGLRWEKLSGMHQTSLRALTPEDREWALSSKKEGA